MSSTIRKLLIDDIRERDDVIRTARTFHDGLKALKEEGPWDVLYLDHDLGQQDGLDGTGIMNWLELNPQYMPDRIRFVTSNPVGKERMKIIANRIYNGTETERHSGGDKETKLKDGQYRKAHVID